MLNESFLNNFTNMASSPELQKQENEQNKVLLVVSTSILILLTMAWFTPTIGGMLHDLDKQIFYMLNGSLQISNSWAQFWGYLNHPNESWINLVVMLGINFGAVLTLKKEYRFKAGLYSLYFWIFFQVLLLITHLIFSDILSIKRSSPTLLIEPVVFLSKILNKSNVKEYSNNCFPAGHTLVAIFWLGFMWNYFKNKILRSTFVLVAILLCTNRLFTGAHWASDVIFTTFYALSWLFVAKLLYNKLSNSKIVMMLKMAYMLKQLKAQS